MPRIILALDSPSASAAAGLLEQLENLSFIVKIGLELFATGEGARLAANLADSGAHVFADWKLHDIPTTVARATAQIAKTKATYLTVHAEEGCLRAATESSGDTGVLAVTLLTSIGKQQLASSGIDLDPAELVVSRARLAAQIGCAGIVCSPAEVAAVRNSVGNEMVIVTPGISSGREQNDDHARYASIAEALAAGATHVVVGRAVRDADDPRAALKKLIEEAGD